MLDDAAGVLLLLFCLAAAGGGLGVAGDSSDADALLAFKFAADPGNRLAFPAPPSNDSASHCRWPGVSCSPSGRVVRLVLVSSGITGFFAPGTLDRLDQLRMLSLLDNSLAGSIPDLSPLVNLRAIFLGHNDFGGRFPHSILSLHHLRVLDLSGNHLAGPVPPALAYLDRLVALRLDSNRFDGSLPAFDQSSLKTLNISFNNFSGEIPTTAVLSSFAASSFAANPALCGKILRKECGGDAHKLFSHSHNGTSPAGANLWQNNRFNLPASSPSQKTHKRAVVVVGFLAIVVVAAAAAALGFLRVRGFGGGGELKAMSSLSRELVFQKLIEASPLLRNKLQFPNLKNSNQSLNWQHQLCKNPRPIPDIKTLFVDHLCGQPNGALASSQANTPPQGAMPKEGSFPPLGAHGPFQPAPTPVLTPLPGWMSSPAPPMAMAAGMNGEGRNMVVVEPRIADESTEKSKIQELTEVNEPAQYRSLMLPLPDSLGTSKISRLIYTHSGNAILALASSAIHLLWKWPRNESHSSGKATTSVAPQLWQPPSGILMTNEITDTNPEEAVHCFTLSKNDCYVISASGGTISLFNAMTFKTMTTFMSPPPAATFLAFHPQDNNIIAIGMEDSTIEIYNVRVYEVKSKLRGHSKRITGLAFSNVLNVLVSSGADAQLCVFETDRWEKQRSRFLQIPSGRTPASISDTHVQFHQDQIHFLAVHETQIALHETTKLECVKQWFPREGSAPISHATFSCDSQSIYASFLDASIGIFNTADFTLHRRVLPAAYIVGNVSTTVYPLAVAAHPLEPNQFAIGMTDGGVYVLEPRESDGTTSQSASSICRAQSLRLFV